MTELCYKNFFSAEVISSLDDCHVLQAPSTRGTGISTDSRTIQPGEIFIALQGDMYDGHSFLLELQEKKVSAFVVQKSNFITMGFSKDHFSLDVGIYVVADTLLFYGKLAKKYFDLFSGVRIVVTGSAGKTTTREYIAQMLSLQYTVFQSKKNYNNRVGIPQSIFSIHKQYDYFVLEAGISQHGEMDFLGDILAPDLIVITSILPAHLDGLDTVEGVYQEKTSLVQFLRPFGSCYVPHWDKALVDGEFNFPPNTNKVLLSQMIQTQSAWSDDHGWITKIKYQETQKEVCIPFAAPFQSKNLSISYAIAREQGVSHETIFDNLEKIVSHPGRFALLCKKPYLVYDAYNANPYSMMESVRWIVDSGIFLTKFFLLGDILEMGIAEQEIHKNIGMQLGSLIKNQQNVFVFFIGPAMRSAFTNCIFEKKQYFFSTREAVQFLQNKIQTDALYYLKASRGMRFEKICQEVFSCSIT